jgi:endonuclease/exonuclease/phosphatase family metal-dependent hydrolase
LPPSGGAQPASAPRRPLGLLRSAARRIAAVAQPSRQAVFISGHPSPAAAPAPVAVTVLSANLWHDWPRQRRWPARLEALARLVEAEQAGVVLLQEVARTASLRADEWLARRLGMDGLYLRANGACAAIGFEEGVAILSRYPLGPPRLCQFGARLNPFVRRVALGALVATPAGPLGAVSVHLSLTPRRNAGQLAALPAWVSRLAGPHPVVVGGDFNAPEHRAAIRQAQARWLDTFRHLHPRAEAATHALRWPWGRAFRRRRLDYIFLHPGRLPWQVVGARHIEAPALPHSDHKAVVARLAPCSPPA